MQVSNNNKKHNRNNNQNLDYQILSHSDKDSSELERSVGSSRTPTVVEEVEEGTEESLMEEEQENRGRCCVGLCVGTVIGVAVIVIILVVVYMVLDYFNKVPSWIVMPTFPMIAQKKPETPFSTLDNRANTVPPPPNKVNLTLVCSEPYMAYHSTDSCSSMCAPGECCFYKFQQGNCILNNLDTCGLYSPCQRYYSASTDTATAETTDIYSNQNKTDGINYNGTTMVVNATQKHRGICGRNITNSSILLCDPKMQACASHLDCITSINHGRQKTADADSAWSYTQCIWNAINCSNLSPH